MCRCLHAYNQQFTSIRPCAVVPRLAPSRVGGRRARAAARRYLDLQNS